MEKKYVTLINNRDIPELKTETILTAKKEPDNKYDSYAIGVYDGSEKLGIISSATKTTVEGTLSNKEIYYLVPDVFRISVQRMDKVVTRREQTVAVCSVEIEDSESLVEERHAVLFVNGSRTKYPAKRMIIAEYNRCLEEHKSEIISGNIEHKLETIDLVVKLNDTNNIVVYYNDEPAGIVDELVSTRHMPIEILQGIKRTLQAVSERKCQFASYPFSGEYTIKIKY